MNQIFRPFLSVLCFVIIIASSCKKDDSTQLPDKKTEPKAIDSLANIASIARPYYNLTVIDVHNHDASDHKYRSSTSIWNTFAIDRVVLFGNISEQSAQTTDSYAMEAYQASRARIIPYMAGINIFDTTCFQYIKNRFAAGTCGIGEVVAETHFSPILTNLPWKGKHALDGYFPQIYELCAQYHKPILLHIDPPSGSSIDSLLAAAKRFPQTTFILGHANAYNSPSGIENILKSSDNIYIDFFAGFTAYNTASEYTLADFVPLITKYPDRFMMGSDSGYEIGYVKSYTAMYKLFNLLPAEIVKKIAGQNYLDITGSAQ